VSQLRFKLSFRVKRQIFYYEMGACHLTTSS
jgi:hypothetical protein